MLTARSQTYADADRATAAADSREPVEDPGTRRPVGVSDHERSDWQNEYQVVVGAWAGKSAAAASSTMPTITGGDAPPESNYGGDDEDQDGIPDQRSRTSEEAFRYFAARLGGLDVFRDHKERFAKGHILYPSKPVGVEPWPKQVRCGSTV